MLYAYLLEQVCHTEGEATSKRHIIAATDCAAEQRSVGQSLRPSTIAEYRIPGPNRHSITPGKYGAGQPRLKDVEVDAAVAETGVTESLVDF